MKRANLNTGIIILLGAGGKQYRDQHIHETVTALSKMGLSASDIIYFSELIPIEDKSYANVSEIDPLSREELLMQGEAIRHGIVSAFQNPPKISRYDIREFIY